MTSSSKSKRDRSVFDAVSLLETQDSHAEKRQRKQTKLEERRRAAATSQMKIFASLMECRILLQRALQQQQQQTTRSHNSTAVASCNELLVNLLTARHRLSPATATPAAIDYASQLAAVPSQQQQQQQQEGSSALSFPQTLEQEYAHYRNEWKQVLDRRHKDVRLHAGLTAKAQFRVVDASFWQQVEATVQHDTILRNSSSSRNATTTNNNNTDASDERPRFDDSKVYQHLLQDFVLSADPSASTKLAQDRLQQEQANKSSSSNSNNNKNKRVDRKASKGRKVRYHEIPKLVNFTFPLSRRRVHNTDGVLQEDDWFGSLFGGASNM
jgi:protein AATF/BFR2